MEPDEIFEQMNNDMKKSIDHYDFHEFNSLHTGKANPSMVESWRMTVDVYGSSMKMRDVAAITTPDARTIQIQPWDKSTVAPIEKGTNRSKLGINPIVTKVDSHAHTKELSWRTKRRTLQNGSKL